MIWSFSNCLIRDLTAFGVKFTCWPISTKEAREFWLRSWRICLSMSSISMDFSDPCMEI